MSDDHELVGRVATVTVPIRPGKPGEVVLSVRGGTEAFAAWADEAITKGQKVVVVDQTGARSVQVTTL
ncbi:MAG TPA: hypothetical protein VFN61_12705 [Acidimicrobiales bacterium]|nr:hypothetical protein [Acidimicrobiales bacterium]